MAIGTGMMGPRPIPGQIPAGWGAGGFGGPTPPPSRTPGSAQNPTNNQGYSQYAPEQYWPNNPGTDDSAALTGLKNFTGVQTGATKDVAGQQNDFQRGQMTLQEQLAEKQSAAEAALRDQMLGKYMGLFSGGGGTASAPNVPPVLGPGGGGADEGAARAAIFARAKDQSGALASAQMKGLQESMAGRGIAGSGMEALGAAGVLGGARGGLDQLNADQMGAELNRAASISDRNYAGNLAQRGQDVTQRGQTLSAQQAALNNLFSLFSARY